MITLQIKDLFCYRQIDLNIPETGPVMITGPNSSGKTSLASIMGALFCHESNPNRLSAAHMKQYVRDGATEGYAALGDVVWTPPSAMTIPQGAEPKSMAHAVGLVNFLNNAVSKSERSKIWENLFLPENPREILEPKWTGTKQQFSAVLAVIEKEGWDQAAKIFAGEKGQWRRSWEEVTGERFGAKKAAEWKPKNWSVELEGVSFEDVNAASVDASDALRALTVQTAVSEEQAEHVRNLEKDVLPKLKEKMESLKSKTSTLKEAHEKARKAFEDKSIEKRDGTLHVDNLKLKMESIKKEASKLGEFQMECDKCKRRWNVDSAGKIYEVDHNSVEEKKSALRKEFGDARDVLKGRIEAQKDVQDEFERLKGVSEEASEAWYQHDMLYNRTLGEVENAQNMIKRYSGVEASRDMSAERSRLENEQHNARIRVDAWQANHKASRAYSNYVEKDLVQKLLEPDGARSEWMQERMDKIRKILAGLCKVTGWKEVVVTRTYEVMSGGRAIQLCAQNEKFKAQWLLQLSVAIMNRNVCGYVVLDAADVMDRQSMVGLWRLATAMKKKFPTIQLIVCATETEPVDGWNMIDLGEEKPHALMMTT